MDGMIAESIVHKSTGVTVYRVSMAKVPPKSGREVVLLADHAARLKIAEDLLRGYIEQHSIEKLDHINFVIRDCRCKLCVQARAALGEKGESHGK